VSTPARSVAIAPPRASRSGNSRHMVELLVPDWRVQGMRASGARRRDDARGRPAVDRDVAGDLGGGVAEACGRAVPGPRARRGWSPSTPTRLCGSAGYVRPGRIPVQHHVDALDTARLQAAGDGARYAPCSGHRGRFPIQPRSKIPAVKDWEAAATRDLWRDERRAAVASTPRTPHAATARRSPSPPGTSRERGEHAFTGTRYVAPALLVERRCDSVRSGGGRRACSDVGRGKSGAHFVVAEPRGAAVERVERAVPRR
jgi:hypothetical protein